MFIEHDKRYLLLHHTAVPTGKFSCGFAVLLFLSSQSAQHIGISLQNVLHRVTQIVVIVSLGTHGLDGKLFAVSSADDQTFFHRRKGEKFRLLIAAHHIRKGDQGAKLLRLEGLGGCDSDVSLVWNPSNMTPIKQKYLDFILSNFPEPL